jgi:hypothetical protein
MVRHQAVCPDGEPSFVGIPLQEAKVRLTVPIRLEDIGPTVPALRYMMRKTWHNYAGYTTHWRRICQHQEWNQGKS